MPLQAFAVVMLASAGGHAQVAPNAGQVTIPGSSLEKPGDTGVRAHTNIEIFRPNRSPEGTEQPRRHQPASRDRSSAPGGTEQ